MRISSALGVLALAACHHAPAANIADGDRIDCALAGADFARDCFIERSADGALLTIHDRDGGFRRLALAPDGTVTAADGADIVTGHQLADGRTEVAIGGDRYRLPPRQ